MSRPKTQAKSPRPRTRKSVDGSRPRVDSRHRQPIGRSGRMRNGTEEAARHSRSDRREKIIAVPTPPGRRPKVSE